MLPVIAQGHGHIGGIMQKSDHMPEPFNLDRYQKVQTDVRALKSRLPEDAVGSIVHEVLSRVTAYRAENGDRINLPSRHKIEQLCYALISEDDHEGQAFIQNVRDDGATLEAVYLSYLAEAATVLGEWWDDDHVGFYEVAIGTSRIYAILRSMSYLFVPDHPVEVKSAIFASVPGETHTLGIRMAADLFGTEGWNIDVMIGKSHEALVAEIKHSPCRILGLSAAGVHCAAPLARLIIALRLCRPDLKIFLSGQVTNVAKDTVALMDLDGTATDIDEGKMIMQQLWSTLGSRSAKR